MLLCPDWFTVISFQIFTDCHLFVELPFFAFLVLLEESQSWCVEAFEVQCIEHPDLQIFQGKTVFQFDPFLVSIDGFHVQINDLHFCKLLNDCL